MRIRFRTVAATYDRGWDPGWIRELRRHAKFVWVRLPGLCRWPRRIVSWERCLSRVSDPRHPPAYAILAPRIDRLSPSTLADRCRWADTLLPHAERLRAMLVDLAASQPCPIGIQADDFAARLWLASGFRPDLVVLDNPIVTRGELTDSAGAAAGVPGLVRATADFVWLDEMPLWRLHFGPDDLARGPLLPGPHARMVQQTLTPSAVAWLRARRPLADWCTSAHEATAPQTG